MTRENRYIVIKRNRLTPEEEQAILQAMPARSWVNGVVVERYWPEYESVWAMIEARVARDKLREALLPFSRLAIADDRMEGLDPDQLRQHVAKARAALRGDEA